MSLCFRFPKSRFSSTVSIYTVNHKKIYKASWHPTNESTDTKNEAFKSKQLGLNKYTGRRLALRVFTSDHTNTTSSLTFDTPEMISVLLFVGVFRATLEADSVSCRMAVSATGSSPLERRLLSEQQKHKYVAQHYTIEIYKKLYTIWSSWKDQSTTDHMSNLSNTVYHDFFCT